METLLLQLWQRCLELAMDVSSSSTSSSTLTDVSAFQDLVLLFTCLLHLQNPTAEDTLTSFLAKIKQNGHPMVHPLPLLSANHFQSMSS